MVSAPPDSTVSLDFMDGMERRELMEDVALEGVDLGAKVSYQGEDHAIELTILAECIGEQM